MQSSSLNPHILPVLPVLLISLSSLLLACQNSIQEPSSKQTQPTKLSMPMIDNKIDSKVVTNTDISVNEMNNKLDDKPANKASTEFNRQLGNKHISQHINQNIKQPRLILIHGLHQSPLVMKPLEKKLSNAGFDVYNYNYYSIFAPVSTHSKKLNCWLLKNHDATQPIYLVGHSLGGLLIRDFLASYPDWKIANVVTLGTPHNGSTTADYSKKLLPFMLGKAYKNGLDGNVAELVDGVNLGVIAGNKSLGLGQPFIWHCNKKRNEQLEQLKQLEEKQFTELQQQAKKSTAQVNEDTTKDKSCANKATLTDAEITNDNDGTVYIHETKLAKASAHIVLPVTHTGMLTNKEVAKQTIYFLQHGEFQP